jgi:hypothetical protein
MFKKNTIKCENCRKKISEEYSFCPHCGDSLIDEEQYQKDYGLLGKENNSDDHPHELTNFGITDKLIGSIMSSLMKNLDKQFKQLDKDPNTNFEKTEIKNFPNGIRIKIGQSAPVKKKKQKDFFRREISEEQLSKISKMPRIKAETKVKRLNNRVIYELSAPGIQSPQDIFVSKLESGYEIKAIGNKKIYVNSLPVNLPLKGFSFNNNKLFVEFSDQQQY